MNKFMKITLAMVLALAMCFSMVACASSEDLDELNAVLDEASEELDALNEELDAELAEGEETAEEVVEEDAEEVVEEEVVEEDAEEAVEEDAEAVEGDVIVSWELAFAFDPEGNEVSAEDMGMTVVYMFNETVLEVAGVVNGEVSVVGTYEEAEDYVVITMDGEEAIGFMDGDYFVVELADGTQQYCALIETVIG